MLEGVGHTGSLLCSGTQECAGGRGAELCGW